MDPAEPKSLFENVSLGVVGAIQMDLEGKPRGVPVAYKGQIWLTEHEQALTANAPRNEADNPFFPGQEKLKLIRKGSDLGHARPIGDDQSPSEAAAAEPEPEGLTGDPVDLEPPREETAAPAPADPPPSAGENEPNPPTEEQPPVPPAPPAAGASSVAADAEPVEPKPLRPGPMAHGGGQPVPPTGAPAPKTPDPSE